MSVHLWKEMKTLLIIAFIGAASALQGPKPVRQNMRRAMYTPLDVTRNLDVSTAKDAIIELGFAQDVRVVAPAPTLSNTMSLEDSSEIDWQEIGLARFLRVKRKPAAGGLSVREQARARGAEVKRGVSFGAGMEDDVARVMGSRKKEKKAVKLVQGEVLVRKRK